MASVKIGDKNIALPSGMSEDELEKAIRKLKADFIKDSMKPPKPATAKKDGGMMKKNLKPVDKEKNPGLAKLPTEVRNKMGFMKDGGMVLEIGLRPATKKENKMAKEMMSKKPKKMRMLGKKLTERQLKL